MTALLCERCTVTLKLSRLERVIWLWTGWRGQGSTRSECQRKKERGREHGAKFQKAHCRVEASVRAQTTQLQKIIKITILKKEQPV